MFRLRKLAMLVNIMTVKRNLAYHAQFLGVTSAVDTINVIIIVMIYYVKHAHKILILALLAFQVTN